MKLVYNSIPDQHMYSPNQLTMQIWNNIINQLRTQTNLNTEYLQQLHKHLFGDSEYKFDTDTPVLSRVSYKDEDETITGQKEYTKHVSFNSGVNINDDLLIKGESSFTNVVHFNEQVDINNNLRVSGKTSFVNNTNFNADGLHTFYGGTHFVGSTRFNWRNVFGPDELQETEESKLPATSFRNSIVTFEESSDVYILKTPTDNYHAVNKAYIDSIESNITTNTNNLANEIDRAKSAENLIESNKLDKKTDANTLYGIDDSGEQQQFSFCYEPNAYTIPNRDGNGQLKVVETPTDSGHATSKKYVDDKITELTNGTVTVDKAKCDANGNDIRYTYTSKNTFNSAINTVVEIAEGKTKSYVITHHTNTSFNSSMDSISLVFPNSIIDTSGNTIDISNLHIGDIVYVLENDVPDRWVSIINSNAVVLHKMETTKVDLTAYVTKNDLVYLESNTIYANDYISTPVIYSQALYDGDDNRIAQFVGGELILDNNGNPINVNKVLGLDEFYMEFTKDISVNEVKQLFAVATENETVSDNYTFENITKTLSTRQRGCCYGNGYFVTLGAGDGAYSTDNGKTWTKITKFTSSQVTSLAYGNGRFICVTADGEIYGTDVPSETWQLLYTIKDTIIESVRYVNNEFIAVGHYGFIARSITGKDWKVVHKYDDTTIDKYFNDVMYGNGKYVVVGIAGLVVTSTNLERWYENNIINYTTDVRCGAYVNGMFVIGTSGGRIDYSEDGEIWYQANNPSSLTIGWVRDFAYGDNRLYVAVYASNGQGEIWLSEDKGKTWSVAHTITGTSRLWRIAFGNDTFVSVGESGTTTRLNLDVTWQHTTPKVDYFYKQVVVQNDGSFTESDLYYHKYPITIEDIENYFTNGNTEAY